MQFIEVPFKDSFFSLKFQDQTKSIISGAKVKSHFC